MEERKTIARMDRQGDEEKEVGPDEAKMASFEPGE
jgi:hypothetical protein